MPESRRFFITTAIDYPNSRPHIGTAFEKIGADVQARYRRMEGYQVHFLMGNDENTVKVAKRAAELGEDPKAYCDEMARQFKEVWRALDISFDDFIQTSEPRHHAGCQKFIQKVFDAGFIYQADYAGWYCDGCESFKTDTDVKEAGGICPDHKVAFIRRTEPCFFFALSKFQQRLLNFYQDHPQFIQPEARKNEILSLVESGLQDVNITRSGQSWGIKVPFADGFTIWVWFDALLNYMTAIGYGSDDERFRKWWPADIHFIGKDITRFHCALWPAMLMAAGLAPPRMVFGHGFVYRKSEDTGALEKLSKTLGNIVEPMEIVTKFSSEAFRYYFMRECPFPGDGEFSWQRFGEVYNADLANNLGNLYSRVVTLIAKNYDGTLANTAGRDPYLITAEPRLHNFWLERKSKRDLAQGIQSHLEACQYHQALEKIWRELLDPANQFAEEGAPWKRVKTDKELAKTMLLNMMEQLRVAAILLKPFLPRSAETIYRSFNFSLDWSAVKFEQVWDRPEQRDDLRIMAVLEGGKVKPLFPRIG